LTQKFFSSNIVTDKVIANRIKSGIMKLKLRYLLVTIILQLFCLSNSNATKYYVSPPGSDTNSGTIDLPFATITKAISSMATGDTIYMRGGVYTFILTINISKNGTSTLRNYLFAYPGERPQLDFSTMVVSSSNRAINLKASYWHIKGIDIKGAGDNGMNISKSNNIIENCAFYENRDTGLQLSGGASNNQILNCDSYFNADPSNGNADGFAPKLDVGTGNYFYGCRSWQNSDDGWDGYLRPSDTISTTLENCWCFMNGYLKNGSKSSGNGNGFKMGGMDNLNDSLRHRMTLKNCIAFDNRVKGFDENNNRGSMTLLNCTAYRNGTNYGIPGALRSGEKLTVKNCIALGSYGTVWNGAVQQTNSWLSPFSGAVETDFMSIDTTGVRGPRKSDGSLPDIPFMHLTPGSQFIDSGTDVGLPFNGNKPDLGYFESGIPTIRVNDKERSRIAGFRLFQNFPNPFNPSTRLEFEVDQVSDIKLSIRNLLGQEIQVLFSGIAHAGEKYSFQFKAQSLPSGVYFSILERGSSIQVKKMILLK
jgi:hypothetical protein